MEVETAETENKEAKPKKIYRLFWAKVEFVDGHHKSYQLSRDLQRAIRMERKVNPNWQANFIGCLLNVPISRYSRHGEVEIDTAKILEVHFRAKRTHDNRQISRSQFVKPVYSWWGWPKRRQMTNYLVHDYNKSSRKRIKRAVRKLTKPNWFNH